MQNKVFYVNGMSCNSCEKIIEELFDEEKGVKKIKAHLRDGRIEVEYDESIISFEKIVKIIDEEGYELIDKKFNSEIINKENFDFFIKLIIIAIIIYLLLRNLPIFNFLPEINETMSIGMLFVAGLLTSFHCIAMCGGINISQCTVQAGGKKSIMPSFLYNMGRVISYTVIGGLVGGIGSVLAFSNFTKAIIMVAAGIFMIGMGIKLADIFPIIKKVNFKIHFLNKIKKYNSSNPFVVGILNGIMPCGPLQSMQLYALGTGSVLMGALSMFIFSIGTFPLMFGLGFLSSFINKKNGKKIICASGAIVLLLGILMIERGIGLAGINLEIESKSEKSELAVNSDGVQVVEMKLSPYGYEPITVTAGKPVKWIIRAEDGDITGCNRAIIVPEYNIEKELVVGENVIEFTPTKTGVFGYSCWMGMIRSSITVVE